MEVTQLGLEEQPGSLRSPPQAGGLLHNTNRICDVRMHRPINVNLCLKFVITRCHMLR